MIGIPADVVDDVTRGIVQPMPSDINAEIQSRRTYIFTGILASIFILYMIFYSVKKNNKKLFYFFTTLTVLPILILISINLFSQERKLLEKYNDEIHIDSNHILTVELERFEFPNQDEHLVELTIVNDNNETVNSFTVENVPLVINCDPKVYDYNGDGNMDYSFRSMMTIRGVNDLRSVFVYDSKNKKFIRIKNSEDYPNLIYNSKTKCLDAWAVHGGITQFFLKLEGDSLYPIYSIEVFGERRILYKYEDGSPVEVKRDSIEETLYPRYDSYKVLD